MTAIRVSGVTDFAALGQRWRDLEARAAGSFFQGWTWTGCLATERFTDPILVEATEDGRTVALALFNRVRGRLFLGESGDPALDCPYIEHNGVLTETARQGPLTEACLQAAARSGTLVLSGVDEPVLSAARAVAGQVWIGRQNESPFVDLVSLRRTGGDYLATRSANTRQQIRRSDRFYASLGDVTVRHAATLDEAHDMLDEMRALHQASWVARGRPGSFARPFFGRFHHALIEAGYPRGEVMLMAVRAGDKLFGILYGFVSAGRVLAYQSGFDYGAAGTQGKPGLTCHHAAIRHALQQGAAVYDFLAGNDRYKRSLADGSVRQYWLEAGSIWSPRLLFRRTRSALQSPPGGVGGVGTAL